ncbi:MAG TPA: SigB/SigF/SigG family RNA polymerase sigma factor [Solirubrobacteraceae bacterium]|nr:SigB/SigF/SigG family RNA polymerase sigma factor [Solirubrobacteraceae bacterium]
MNSFSRTDSTALFIRWREQGDRGAREELVRRHLPLARKLAGRYAHTQEPFDDLFQVASLALVKAIDRFDPDRGLTFASFAVPTIVGELKRHFRDKGWALHIPRGLQEMMLNVKNAEATLASKTGRSPTVFEIAEYLGVETEHVLDALEATAARQAASLDEPLVGDAHDNSDSIHETIGCDDQGYELVDTSVSLAAAVKQLRAADRRVLALRVGNDLTQKQIADRIGVSQMQVSRILRRVSGELRELIGLETGSAAAPDAPFSLGDATRLDPVRPI